MIDQSILQQNIITVLGIQNLPDERKLALIDKMAQLVEKRLLLRILDGMSESDAAEFAKVAEGSNDEKAAFLAVKFPNFSDILQEEIVAVKKDVLEAGKVEE